MSLRTENMFNMFNSVHKVNSVLVLEFGEILQISAELWHFVDNNLYCLSMGGVL